MACFGANLRRLRKENRLSQSDLAKQTGLTRSAISMYEVGQREPNFETLEIFADYFNVPLASLIDDKNLLSNMDNLPSEIWYQVYTEVSNLPSHVAEALGRHNLEFLFAWVDCSPLPDLGHVFSDEEVAFILALRDAPQDTKNKIRDMLDF